MSDRAVCITGARGFLGRHLTEAFNSGGWTVTAVVRPGRRAEFPRGVRVVEASLDALALAPVFEGAALVIHAAALTSARDESAISRVNVDGTASVVEAANRVGARVLFISSLAAAGVGTAARPVREGDEPKPVTSYGRSKLAAEVALCRLATEPWLIVRPSAVYGPGDRQFLPLFRLAARGWFPLIANPAASFTFLYVDDFVRAMLAGAEALKRAGRAGEAGGAGAAGGVLFFLGHPQPQTTEEVLGQLAKTFARPYRATRVPGWALRVIAAAAGLSWQIGWKPMLDRDRLAELQADGFVCAVDRARAAIGFTAAVDFSEGLVHTARWYREHGWL